MLLYLFIGTGNGINSKQIDGVIFLYIALLYLFTDIEHRKLLSDFI